MAEVFEDEIDQTVTIEEYIKGVDEQELVIYLCFTLVFGGFIFSLSVFIDDFALLKNKTLHRKLIWYWEGMRARSVLIPKDI